MKAPIPRYEQAARKGEDAIRRLRELAPSYEDLGKIDAAIAALDSAVPRGARPPRISTDAHSARMNDG